MPEFKKFNGRPVKNARRVNGIIRITFKGPAGKPGQQQDVTPEQYDAGVKRWFSPGPLSGTT